MHEKINAERALRFKMIRTSLCLSQKEFGDALGISQNYVSTIEQAKRNITAKILSNLEIKFNINPNWVLSNNGDMHVSLTDKLHITTAELKDIIRSYELLDANKQKIVKSMIEELSKK